jgi:ATP-dependent helicase/nuclease subunit B
VRHGEDARRTLQSCLDEHKLRDRLAPVTVVVRSPLAGLDLRRRLASHAALVNVSFSLLSWLAELLGAPELMSDAPGAALRRPLTSAALGAALRAALDEEPGLLAPVADHPSTEEALAVTYRDLRQANAEELARLRACGARAADVVRLAGRARQLLSPCWYDVDDMADAAARALREGRGSLDDVGPVVLHLPEVLRPSELGLVAALAGRTTVQVIVGATGDEGEDVAISALADRLSGCLGCAPVEAVGVEPRAEAGVDRGERPGATRGEAPSFAVSEVVNAPDPEAEVREAIRQVLAHVESGRSFGRCAIAHPGSRRYARLLAEQLDASGLAWNGPAPDALGRDPEARVLSGLVDLARPPLELERAEVIAWLGRGPVLTGDRGAAPLGAWDRTSREAGVVSGSDEWQSRLAAHERRCRNDRPDEAELAAGLREFMARLAEVCAELGRCTSWASFASWARAALADYLAPRDDDASRLVALALDELAALDAFEPLAGLPPSIRHERLSRSLGTSLDRPAPRIGRYGHGVVAAPIADLVGLETELLVVVGAVEGQLPGRTGDDPLLPMRERARAGAAHLVRERAEVRARRHLVALLCGADRSVMTTARVDTREGRPAIGSRWLDGDLGAGAVETNIGSFAGALGRVARGIVPACDGLDYELASIQAWREAGRSSDRHFLATLVPEFAAALEVARARAGGSLGRFNGGAARRVGDADAGEQRSDRLLSATTLEVYAACPFQGFLRHQLRLRDIDAPERRITIEPMDRGSLVHEVLERLVAELLESGRRWSSWTAEDHARLAELAGEAFDDYERRGLVGKALLWELEKSQILLDLDRFLDIDDRRCRSADRVPAAAEFSFGDENVAPLEVVAAGRTVRFRGKIDRVDRGAGGSLTVVDYKTGSSGSFAVLESDPVGHGERLQLAIYGLAAQAGFPIRGAVREEAGGGEGDLTAEYRFVSSNADKESIGIVLDDAARRRLGEALDTLVGLIDDDSFPARPGVVDRTSYKNCQRCDFDSLCTADRDRAWQRVRSDARLRDYVALVEPAVPLAGDLLALDAVSDAL